MSVCLSVNDGLCVYVCWLTDDRVFIGASLRVSHTDLEVQGHHSLSYTNTLEMFRSPAGPSDLRLDFRKTDQVPERKAVSVYYIIKF